MTDETPAPAPGSPATDETPAPAPGSPATASAPARGRSPARRIIQGTVSLVLVVAIFVFVLPQFADFSEVWAQIRAMTSLELASLGVAALWNVFSYCLVLVPVLPGLTYGQAMVVAQSSTAVANTLPGGAGVGIGISYAMYASWGFPRPDIALSVLVSGIWNSFVKLGMPVLALALVALEGRATVGRVTAAGVGLAALVVSVGVFALMLRRERSALRVGEALGRLVRRVTGLARRPKGEGWGQAAVHFRARTIGLIRDRWLRITVGTVVSHLSLYAVLLLCLRHVGVSEKAVSWAEVLAAFAFVRLISALPITPGGLGVVEVALIAALVTAGGPHAKVVAAVLVYRLLTYVLPVPLGALTYVVWRRNRRWRKPAPAPGGSDPPLAGDAVAALAHGSAAP